MHWKLRRYFEALSPYTPQSWSCIGPQCSKVQRLREDRECLDVNLMKDEENVCAGSEQAGGSEVLIYHVAMNLLN